MQWDHCAHSPSELPPWQNSSLQPQINQQWPVEWGLQRAPDSLLAAVYFVLCPPCNTECMTQFIYGSTLSRALERWGMTTGTILLTGHLPSLGEGEKAQGMHCNRAVCSRNEALSITPTEPGLCIILKEINATKAAQKSPSLKIQSWESRLTLLTKHSFNRNV